MNFLFICVVSAFLTITLSDKPREEILMAPFHFYYEQGDKLNVKVILKNIPADVDFNVHTCCISSIQQIVKERDNFLLQLTLSRSVIIVSINLLNNSRLYKTLRILKGRTENVTIDKYQHNDVCLNRNSPCTIELDLKDLYPVSAAAEINTLYTVAIASAVSGMALVLLAILAIVAIKKRCWVKASPPAPYRVQKNKVNNPFYVNLLFLKECAKEIEALENHVYEEINP